MLAGAPLGGHREHTAGPRHRAGPAPRTYPRRRPRGARPDRPSPPGREGKASKIEHLQHWLTHWAAQVEIERRPDLSTRRSRALATIHGTTSKDDPAFRSAMDELRAIEDAATQAVSEYRGPVGSRPFGAGAFSCLGQPCKTRMPSRQCDWAPTGTRRYGSDGRVGGQPDEPGPRLGGDRQDRSGADL